MGRPAKFNRDAALDTAMLHFWKHGFEATSVSDLAAAMGITRSSFYNSFESRENAFEQVLERYKETQPDRFLADIKAGDPILPVIEGLFHDVCKLRSEDRDAKGCLLVNCLGEMNDGTNEPPLIRTMFDSKIDLFEALLTQAQDQEEIAKDRDTRTLATELVSFLSGLNMISKVVRSEDKLWAMCQSFLVAHGLSETS